MLGENQGSFVEREERKSAQYDKKKITYTQAGTTWVGFYAIPLSKIEEFEKSPTRFITTSTDCQTIYLVKKSDYLEKEKQHNDAAEQKFQEMCIHKGGFRR